MTTLVNELAYNYVRTRKDLDGVRSNDFLEFYFDEVKPYLNKAFDEMNEVKDKMNATENIKKRNEQVIAVINKTISNNADYIATKVLQKHGAALEKHFRESMNLNKKLYHLEKQVEQLDDNSIKDFVKQATKYDLKLHFDMPPAFLKKFDQLFSNNNHT